MNPSLSGLDTPALLLDLDVLEANIARIAAACAAQGVAWRPHIKSHKSVDIARLQIAHGAAGVTCAKLGEAEVMAAAGIGGIVIANQIVGAPKVARLAALLEHTDPVVCVDSRANVDELAAGVAGAPRRLRVAIEVNIGMNRAGVEPEDTVALARYIAGSPQLALVGVLAWEAQTPAIADPAEKRAAIAAAIAKLSGAADACRAAGLPVEMVSCGGTGTFPTSIGQPGVTEVQVGGGSFGDRHYREHYNVDFPPALQILTTVVSRPTSTRIIVDAGRKAMSADAHDPLPVGLPPLRELKLSAEHTTLELAAPSAIPAIGDHVTFHLGYSDTTVHLHEEYVVLRGGVPVDRWPVSARGRIK